MEKMPHVLVASETSLGRSEIFIINSYYMIKVHDKSASLKSQYNENLSENTKRQQRVTCIRHRQRSFAFEKMDIHKIKHAKQRDRRETCQLVKR